MTTSELASAQTDDARRLLSFTQDNRERSLLMNIFLDAVHKHGATTVAAVRFQVAEELRRRLAFCHSGASGACYRRFLALLNTESAAVDALAEYVLLPQAVRDAQKRERKEPHVRAWMADRAPTPRQLAYLRALGDTQSVANRWEASRRIDACLRHRQESPA